MESYRSNKIPGFIANQDGHTAINTWKIWKGKHCIWMCLALPIIIINNVDRTNMNSTRSTILDGWQWLGYNQQEVVTKPEDTHGALLATLWYMPDSLVRLSTNMWILQDTRPSAQMRTHTDHTHRRTKYVYTRRRIYTLVLSLSLLYLPLFLLLQGIILFIQTTIGLHCNSKSTSLSLSLSLSLAPSLPPSLSLSLFCSPHTCMCVESSQRT